MRHLTQIFSKILMFVLLGAIGVAGSLYVMNHVLKNHAGVANIAGLLETIRLRTAHPTMSPEKIAEEAAKANPDPVALLQTLAAGKVGVAAVANSGRAPATGETEKASATTASATGREIQLKDAADGREVIGIVPAGGPKDFNAIDRINALNIPDDLKNKILKNYEATGVLPEIVMREKRKPAAVTGEPGTEL